MNTTASTTERREGSLAWQPFLIAFTLATIAIVHLQVADAGFRAAFPQHPVLAVARGVLRIPLVYLRLLVDHASAIPLTAGAVGLLVMAWWASIGASRERLTKLVEWLGVVLAIVAVAWFFRFGKNDWGFMPDWQKDWGYYSTLKPAAETFRLPLYSRTAVGDRTPNQRTERYFANAETLVGPHALLLAFMDIRDFYLLHALLTAAIGAAGLVTLRREIGLAPFAWVLFLVVCFLNGHVTARLHEGSTPWVSLWLLPWVFRCLIRLREGDDGPRNGAVLALCLGGMIVNGSWHIFFWSLMLTGLSVFGRRPPFRFVARLLVFVGMIGSFRLVPAVLTFGGGDNEFLGGFSSPADLFMSLIGEGRDGERDYFVGWVGVALIAIGLIPSAPHSKSAVDALRWPSVAFFILSMGSLYRRHTVPAAGIRIAARGAQVCDRWRAWFAPGGRPADSTVAGLAAPTPDVADLGGTSGRHDSDRPVGPVCRVGASASGRVGAASV